jgi:hypothetical protein
MTFFEFFGECVKMKKPAIVEFAGFCTYLIKVFAEREGLAALIPWGGA